MKNWLVCILLLVVLSISPGIVLAQPPPPIPADYSGSVTVDGSAPDGTEVFAKIEDYTSDKVTTSDGSYKYLVVGPPDDTYIGKTVEFWVDVPGDLSPVKAVETDVFDLGTSHPSFGLTVATTTAENNKSTPLSLAPISAIIVIVILIAGVWYWRQRR